MRKIHQKCRCIKGDTSFSPRMRPSVAARRVVRVSASSFCWAIFGINVLHQAHSFINEATQIVTRKTSSNCWCRAWSSVRCVLRRPRIILRRLRIILRRLRMCRVRMQSGGLNQRHGRGSIQQGTVRRAPRWLHRLFAFAGQRMVVGHGDSKRWNVMQPKPGEAKGGQGDRKIFGALGRGPCATDQPYL